MSNGLGVLQEKREGDILQATINVIVDDYSMTQYGWEIGMEGREVQYFSSNISAWELKP